MNRSRRRALLLLAVAALASPVAAETFVFRDAERGQAHGKVLAEFEDLLFVALDGEAPRFVSRAELEAIIDEAGNRFEAPPPGTFGRPGGATPRAAATDLVGEVLVRHGAAEPASEGEGPLFLREGEALVTGDAGLARLVLVSGTTAKVAPATEVHLPSGPGERADLLAGELLVETELRPLELWLRGDVSLRVAGASRVGAEASPDARHVLLHAGSAELVWSDLRVVLQPGLGVELVQAGPGSWRVTADRANTDALEVRLASTVEQLEPGAAKVYGATAETEELWRLDRSQGELFVRRGPEGALAPVAPAQRERLALAAGDALVVGEGAASLGRVDGAQARVLAGSTLEVGAHELSLARGRVEVETTQSPVLVALPSGVAAVRMATLHLERVDERQVVVRALAGSPEVPLGASAVLALDPAAQARISRDEAGRVDAELTLGQGTVTSRPHARGPDARFRVPLAAGQRVGLVEAPVEGAMGVEGRTEVFPTLLLAGERALAFQSADVRATVTLDPTWEVAFEAGGRVLLTDTLWLGLSSVQGRPEVCFKAGPRVRLAHPARVRVHNPRVEVLDASGRTTADLELDDAVSVRLDAPTDVAAAVLGARQDDRLEVPHGGSATIDLDGDVLRIAHGDGRRLLIQEAAPPVQARLDDAQGTLYLTMPGAPPLGLAPGRPITVMATNEGEFVILGDDQLRLDAEGLELLTGVPKTPLETISRDRGRDLLDVPPPDSPSGP